MPLEPDELTLRHGYRLAVIAENGFVHSIHRSESLAVRKLLELRQAWIGGYYAGKKESESTIRELCKA